MDAKAGTAIVSVTQNVDDLHEQRAGAGCVLHMHGTHLNAWCTACDVRTPWTGPLIDRPACPPRAPAPRCRLVRREPCEMGRIYSALRRADLFVSIGTSGAV